MYFTPFQSSLYAFVYYLESMLHVSAECDFILCPKQTGSYSLPAIASSKEMLSRN